MNGDYFKTTFTAGGQRTTIHTSGHILPHFAASAVKKEQMHPTNLLLGILVGLGSTPRHRSGTADTYNFLPTAPGTSFARCFPRLSQSPLIFYPAPTEPPRAWQGSRQWRSQSYSLLPPLQCSRWPGVWQLRQWGDERCSECSWFTSELLLRLQGKAVLPSPSWNERANYTSVL